MPSRFCLLFCWHVCCGRGGGGRDTRGNTAACGNIIVWLLFLVLLCYVLCVRRLAKEAIVECGG